MEAGWGRLESSKESSEKTLQIAKLAISNYQLSVYPNPSVGNAVIKYSLPENASIRLGLYDISGRLVKTIYSGVQEKGNYEVNVGSNLSVRPTGQVRHMGLSLPKGIYFVKLEADKFIATKKLTIF